MLHYQPLNTQNITDIYSILSQLRTQLKLDGLKKLISHDEYKIELVLIDSQPIAVIGYRVLETITRGFHLHLHDLVVDLKVRGKGYGQIIVKDLAAIFSKQGCRWIFLDGVDTALNFYDKIGFVKHQATLLKLNLTK